jgi:hypothetical protein
MPAAPPLSAAAFAAEKERVKALRAAGLLDAEEAAELLMHLVRRVDLGAGAGSAGAGSAGAGSAGPGGAGAGSAGAAGNGAASSLRAGAPVAAGDSAASSSRAGASAAAAGAGASFAAFFSSLPAAAAAAAAAPSFPVSAAAAAADGAGLDAGPASARACACCGRGGVCSSYHTLKMNRDRSLSCKDCDGKHCARCLGGRCPACCKPGPATPLATEAGLTAAAAALAAAPGRFGAGRHAHPLGLASGVAGHSYVSASFECGACRRRTAAGPSFTCAQCAYDECPPCYAKSTA